MRYVRPARVLIVLVVMAVLVACGGNASSPGGPVSPFPATPAGAQARWFFQAVGRQPIPEAAIRAHFAPATLRQLPAEAINARLAGAAQVGLVSVTSQRPESVVLVLSIRHAQRFRLGITVDSSGLIAGLTTEELMSTASPASMIPALGAGWLAEPVTFQAGDVTIHATYTHPPDAAAGTLPAAVLIGGLGSTTDRNDNTPDQPDRNTLSAVANWLSADGIASLRYDKLGTGDTGWGPYADHPQQTGIEPYQQEAVAALEFLAGRPQVDRARLAVFGHSEGAIYALLVAAGRAGPAPAVRALGLLEPVSVRLLDLFLESSSASLTTAVENGEITAGQAQNLQEAMAGAIASLRSTGTLPSGLPDAVAATFQGSNTLPELTQVDRYDPAALAAELPPGTSVLLTCSNADDKFGCPQVDRLAAGVSEASARLHYVHLEGVDHFLKEDISRQPADYNESLPFSSQLRAELTTFLAGNL